MTTHEEIAVALLRVMDANRTRFGLSLAAVVHLASVNGFAPVPDGEATCAALDFFVRNKFVQESYSRPNPQRPDDALQVYLRITEEGTEFLDEALTEKEP